MLCGKSLAPLFTHDPLNLIDEIVGRARDWRGLPRSFARADHDRGDPTAAAQHSQRKANRQRLVKINPTTGAFAAQITNLIQGNTRLIPGRNPK
jgi:hypothetical protein